MSVVLSGLLLVSGCVDSGPRKPTPQAAQQILKLQGYEFDDKSFLAAIEASDQSAITAFLDGGIDFNKQSGPGGETPLIFASVRGHLETVKKLLQRGANPNLQDKQGSTALFRALESRHAEVADALLSHPALDLNARGLNGVTALIAYVSRDRDEKVKMILERGADVKSQDADGDTALHVAARNGSVTMIELLLSKGADVNARNKVGGTPLMWAAVFGHEDVTRLLLERGADSTVKDNSGMTAAAWAAKNQRDGVVEVLRGR